MKYKTFLENHPGRILGVSLLGVFTSLAMVYAGYSLLEKLKERIGPGWLKAAARAVYNSGGRIEPDSEPA